MLRKQKISTGLIGHFFYLTFPYLLAWYHFHSRHGYNYRPDRPPLTLPTLPFLTIPYLTLPYPSLPYLSLPHPTLPYPTPPYLAFLYLLA